MDFDISDIAAVAQSGLEQALEQKSVVFVEHGFCWYCNEEKAVYEASPEWPVQPPRCFDCYVDAIKSIFDNPEHLAEMLNSAWEDEKDDQE